MKHLFHKTDLSAPLVELQPDLLDAALQRGGLVWLDLRGEAPDEILRVCTKLNFDSHAIEESLEPGTTPRVEDYPDHLYVVLASARTGHGTRLGVTELDMFFNATVLVTIHEDGASPSIDHIQENLEVTSEISSPAMLAGLIAQVGARRFGPLIEALEVRIDALEEGALRADPHTLPEVHALRRDVVLLQRYAGRQREVYGELAVMQHPVVDEATRQFFDNFYSHQSRLADSLDGARILLNSVVETYRGAVADQTNEIVRILTVFSAIMLPLSLIAGMWGMNFIDIPAGEERWGFWILVGVMVLVGAGFWIYFVRRGFVGAPRLREIPKSVGLGIVQVGVAPIKAVSSGIGTTVRGIGKRVSGPDEDQSSAESSNP